MRVAVLGLGYVGLTGAACLLREGHDVVGIDINEAKISSIQGGRSPIFEPGVDKLLHEGLKQGQLQLATTCAGRLASCEIVLVCVGTPSATDGSHDMSHVAEASRQLALALDVLTDRPLTIAFRSTFQPGTMERLIRPLLQTHLGDSFQRIDLVYNPEFLRESTAISDYYAPSRVVIGTSDGQPSRAMEALYEGVTGPRFVTKYREAEMIKMVDNSFHALKASFANEIGRVCTHLGVNVRQIHEMFIADTKLNISPCYLRPGAPFGGSCLPKDVRALAALSHKTNAEALLIDSLLRTNDVHKQFILEYVLRDLPPRSRLLMNGIAFKEDSDDLRDSPYVDLAFAISAAGHTLHIYDPCVKPDLLVGQNLGYALSHLPELAKLLIDRQTLDSTDYDRLIDVRGKADSSVGKFGSIVSIHALS